MDFLKEYQKKLTTADEAVKVVRSGDWIEHAFGVNGANELDQALAKRKDELWDVKIRADIGAWPHYTLEADQTEEHFIWMSWHVAGQDKKYINGKGLYYVPMKFHECPVMTRNDAVPNNVFMATVSPMDKHGYFSFGAGCPSAMAAVENAEYVMLEVNTNMPRVLGGNQESVHISQVTHVVEGSNPPLPTLPAANPNEVEKKIASNIIERLYDGC
ncbi:MAG TPA: butyryl-CoA:acetate CoA-transferase, partial [Syntrophomonas sp.]|nr:butyryl-CoA:acetate CoA-transferase [Syntrophomonas sp.]